MICVASDHGTIHIFALEDQSLNKQSSLASNFLPKYFSSSWSFCKFQVPNGPQCVCAFGSENNCIIGNNFNLYYIVRISYNCAKITFSVVCADGNYYKFVFNQKGECWRDICAQFLEITNDNNIIS